MTEDTKQPTEEQKAVMKAKLDEMKLKRAGKIPQDAKAQGVPASPMDNRLDNEKVGKVTKEIMQKLKDEGFMADQLFHTGAELQLFAVNEMILNGLTNFGGEVEKYVKKEIGEIKNGKEGNEKQGDKVPANSGE